MTQETNHDLEWLIRDSSNVLRGPYKHAEVLQLIKKGQIRGKTEISRANSYWFALEEKAEVARFFPELGIKAPEQPTQMTATLTQAEHSEQGVEVTQFTPSLASKDLTGAEKAGGEEKIEWLNEEFAEEFGADLADPSPLSEMDQESTQTNLSVEEGDPGGSLLESSSSIQDALPSERHDYVGARPKPMDSVLKGVEKPRPQAPVLVSVPVKNLDHQHAYSEEGKKNLGRGWKIAAVVLLILVVGGSAAGLFYYLSKNGGGPIGAEIPRAPRLVSEATVKGSLLLFNLEEAKSNLTEFELAPSAGNSVMLPVAQALLRKEFLYDIDGAIVSLQTAKSLATDKKVEAEIDNLLAVYGYEQNRESSLEGLRALVGAFPADPVFRYNLSLALLRNGNARDAIQAANALAESLDRSNPLADDAYLVLGWARDLSTNGTDASAEAAYLKALERDPHSAKARLALALHRLRKGGLRASENDFRAFVEAMPELDPPSRVMNFRQMSDFDFYNFARGQIRELNVPMGAAGVKPSPLIMAVDAMLSCLQSRTSEAGKILEGALNSAPGDVHLLKAVGYHRWKDGRYPEIIDLLKDLPADKQSYAVHLLLGKALLKVGRRDLVEGYFEGLTRQNPKRVEGWAQLGDFQLQLGKNEAAKASLASALERDPLDLVALRGLHRLGQPNIITPEIASNLPF